MPSRCRARGVYRRDCVYFSKKPGKSRIKHHARPMRASAAPPLRTDADTCRTGSGADRRAGASAEPTRTGRCDLHLHAYAHACNACIARRGQREPGNAQELTHRATGNAEDNGKEPCHASDSKSKHDEPNQNLPPYTS